MFKVQSKTRASLWFISFAMLAILLLADFAAAARKNRPVASPMNNMSTVGTDGSQRTDKSAEARPKAGVGSIFDDQADENEEPTYRPPTDIEQRLESLKLPKDVSKHLKDKYRMKGNVLDQNTIKQTLYGPSGKISIDGWDKNLKPQTEIVGESKEERARAIAKAFMAEEAELLGIVDITEIKENKIVIGQGERGDYINIHYGRVINGVELKGSYIHITIGPEETITRVNADVIAPPHISIMPLPRRPLAEARFLELSGTT